MREHINVDDNYKMASQSAKELPLFSVLPENGSNQLLQVNLRFAEYFHYCGRVIYSNHTQPKISQYKQGWRWIGGAAKIPPFFKWVNLTNKLQIVGLSHSIHSGPILILDINTYRQGLYVSQPHLLATCLPLSEERKGRQLTNLVYVNFSNEGLLEQTIALQAQTGSMIIEKYLGVDEEFCIYDNQSVIAVSETMQVELVAGKIGKFKGPGWLFFETGQRKSEEREERKVWIILILAAFYLLYIGWHLI